MTEKRKISRRRMLQFMGMATAGAALAACAAPTAPSADGGEGAAPSEARKELSIATYASPANDWQRDTAAAWAEANPDVDLTIDAIVYGEMNKKQQAAMATNTLWDVSFSGVKWFPFLVNAGAFISLDDWVAQEDPGMDDFFPAALSGSSFEGQLYGLPYLMHPGNPALIIFNLDLLDAKGLEAPADNNYTTEEYGLLAAAAADPDNKIYGTNLMPGNYYDHCSFARTYGGDILDATQDNFIFNVDPASIEAAQWVTSLRTELGAAPNRAEAEGLEFSAGNMATATLGVYAVGGLEETIGDRFRYDIRLFPNSPDHERGYQGFVECFSVAAQSEHPELAYSLTMAESSTEAALEATISNAKMPGPRTSIWTNPEVQEVSPPIMDDAALWMASQDGPFPHPSNLRFQELQDTWANTSLELFYGEVGFEEGMEAVQTACQEIMELPRA